ncbi:MAG: guanylate kinase [Clostridiales Family XIII bacterium]|jgi:guanylate kinase|nr:guanylate kinase [Clostridiales Family XIII bacterium]
MTKKGTLFVVSGPSAVGKGTICDELAGRGQVFLSVSMTTRPPRHGESDGKDYIFVSKEAFERTVSEGGFLEYAEVYGNYYGTPKTPVAERLDAGEDVVLEIDVQGAMKIKEHCPDGVFVFILPPSMEELRKRITGRAADTEKSIDLRLGKALREIGCIGGYDYYIVNERLETAVNRMEAIIEAARARVAEDAEALIRTYEEEGITCCIHQ